MTKRATSRTLVRRDLKQAMTHLKRVQGYLIRSGHLYEAQHPQVYQLFCVLIAFADQLESGLRDLRSHL